MYFHCQNVAKDFTLNFRVFFLDQFTEMPTVLQVQLADSDQPVPLHGMLEAIATRFLKHKCYV